MKRTGNTMHSARRKPWLATIMVVCCTAFTSNINSVFADTHTANLNISASINAKCLLNPGGGPSGQNILFGEYDPIVENATTSDTASSSINVKCTKNTTAQIAINNGLYSAHATSVSRAMSDGAGSYLSYDIYSDASMTSVWTTTNTVAYTDTGGPFSSLPIYAAIPPGQNVAAGNYTDTVTMTINY